MAQWYVWGDFVHTRPERVGGARIVEGAAREAEHAAKESGFDLETRRRNGFESWAAAYAGGEGDDQAFAFAAFPTVRGWTPANR